MSDGSSRESAPASRARLYVASVSLTYTVGCFFHRMVLFRFSKSPFVLRDPSLYQLPHKGVRQGLVRLKADGPLAGVVVLEFVLVSLHRGRTHEVEGAVVRCRAEGHKHSVLTESGE